jgi:iron complex transport system ATP-binding protein
MSREVGGGTDEEQSSHASVDGESSTASVIDGASIDVTDLSICFGDLPVLDAVSLDIEAGELVGLVGPNGAGKTTLLRAISGALSPDAGTVRIQGTDVHGLDSRASSQFVAVVPQNTALSFSFPVRDVVAMGRHPHRSRFAPPSDADRQAVERALDRTGTAAFADRPIDELSGGQRQRVVLARAIAQETPVLLLDEPTASLDVNHQVEMLSLVRSLVDDGRTVVAAIHDLDLAARYCDRLALLADGAIRTVGPPEEVLAAETVSAVFDTTAAVTANPVTDTPSVTTLSNAAADPGTREERDDRDLHPEQSDSLPGRVHVIGSGRTAAAVLVRLATAGIDVSVGPVPERAVVTQVTRQHDVDVLSVEPFTPISSAVRAKLENFVRTADVVVLARPGTELDAQLDLDSVCRSTPVVEADSVADAPSTGPMQDDRSLTAETAGTPTLLRRHVHRSEATPETIVDAVRTATARNSSE